MKTLGRALQTQAIVLSKEWVDVRRVDLSTENGLTGLRVDLRRQRHALFRVNVEKRVPVQGCERKADTRRPLRRTEPTKSLSLNLRLSPYSQQIGSGVPEHI